MKEVSASWKKMPLSACHPTAETSQHHTCYRFQDATDRHPQHHVLHDFRHIGQTRLIHRVPEFKGLYPLSCVDKKASVPFNQTRFQPSGFHPNEVAQPCHAMEMREISAESSYDFDGWYGPPETS